MAPMSFTKLTDSDRQQLRDIALQSIRHGLSFHAPLPLSLKDYNELLRTEGASFVTLNLHGNLRGCIGTLEAYQPLVKDVADHAYAAAFSDPRFAAVTDSEIDQLDIHISVLTPATKIEFTSEQDLLTKIRPNIDGLILDDGYHKGTFLPSVWEQLAEPVDFLQHLKLKAGLDKNDWNEQIQVYRYHTISF